MAPPSPPEEERGYLDFLVDGMAAMGEMTQILSEIAAETTAVGKSAELWASQLDAINQNPGPGTPAQAHRIATLAASDMNKYSDKVEGLGAKLDKSVESISDNVGNWLTWVPVPSETQKAELQQFRGQIAEFLDVIQTSLAKNRNYRETIFGLRGISREMGRASRRKVQILDGLNNSMAKLEAFCVRALAMLDEKLATPAVLNVSEPPSPTP